MRTFLFSGQNFAQFGVELGFSEGSIQELFHRLGVGLEVCMHHELAFNFTGFKNRSGSGGLELLGARTSDRGAKMRMSADTTSLVMSAHDDMTSGMYALVKILQIRPAGCTSPRHETRRD